MKKVFLYLLVTTAVFFRLIQWKNHKEMADSICVRQLKPFPQAITFTGYFEYFQGKYLLNTSDFKGKIEVYSTSKLEQKFLDVPVKVVGPFKCRYPFQNPSVIDDGIGFYRLPVLYTDRDKVRISLETKIDKPIISQVRRKFEGYIESHFREYPHLFSFERALWFGDLSQMPKAWVTFYQEAGVLQILALSGQHVAGLLLFSLLLWKLASFIFPSLFHGKLYYIKVRRLLPVMVSGILCLTGLGVASMQRTFIMMFFQFICLQLVWNVSLLQLLCSGAAVLILINPDFVVSPSFILSFFSTSFLIPLSFSMQSKKGWGRYFLFCFFMPFLIFPLTAFYFGKISFTASFHSIFLSWIWDGGVIPVLFVLAMIVQGVPSFVLEKLDRSLGCFIEWHEIGFGAASAGYITVIRPSLTEYFLIEAIGLLTISWLLNRIFSARSYSSVDQQ